MNISALQSFASDARRRLMGAVSAKLDAALTPGSSARVDVSAAVERLEQEIKEHDGGEQGRQHVVERYAYRWFNRIIAFRYMDVHGFTAVPVASAVELTDVNGLPGVLVAAKRGEYDEDVFGGSSTMGNAKLRDTVEALFNGSLQSDDPQGQAYGLLLQAECRYWSQFMPFMFERVDSSQGKVDELLMPADLLAEGSVLRQAVATMTPDDCEDVEIIGWLYQFYIAERKTEVMNGFSKSKKAGADEIPAATQLFTPDWIVKYLVQNTVGRLWMQNHPDSQLYQDWEYYIQPEPEQNDQSEFLHIDNPEELTVCDPACGSGHMLTYAFDLLYGIYEEQGYSPSEIPGLILANNLYGMEIDERAANLAAFALTMKARAKDRRFFRDGRRVEPHIRLISKERFTSDEVRELNELYKVSLDDEVWNTYANADIVGSLIQPPQELVTLAESQTNDSANDEAVTERRQSNWREVSPSKGKSGGVVTLLRADLAQRSTTIFTHTRYLAHKYSVVLSNPPYMISRNMCKELVTYIGEQFPCGSGDLFASFMLRNLELLDESAYVGMITMQTWMFGSSFRDVRNEIIEQTAVQSLLHLGARAFDSISGEVVSTVTFVLLNTQSSDKGYFFDLTEGQTCQEKREMFLRKKQIRDYKGLSVSLFKKLPGMQFAYWGKKELINLFSLSDKISDECELKSGISTGDNNRFERVWSEISFNHIILPDFNNGICDGPWTPCNSGGSFRRWYGNNEIVMDWTNDGELIFQQKGSAVRNRSYQGKGGITYSKISGNLFAGRVSSPGFLFDDAGRMIFPHQGKELFVELAVLNSSVIQAMLAMLTPGLNFTSSEIGDIPIPYSLSNEIAKIAYYCYLISKQDWDSCETSWDYQRVALLNQSRNDSVEHAVASLSQQWRILSEEQRQREIRNNELVADAYGVRDDVPCDVPLERVSLKRNSAFVYPDKTPVERDELFARDVVKEFISYAVGCMFGRYSIDKPGLILASQGETVDDFHERVPDARFEPDKDNVIPVSEVDCFEDDIVSRFRRFLEVTFGSEHLAENLAYIERTLGKPLRKYFVNDFYNDHVAMYKNRPIYWQYSSRTDNKGAFKALIYMHRYTPATTHTVLEYLRDFTAKIADQANQLERSDRTKDKREAEKLHKAVTECKAYEDNILYPLATRNLEIDLDDGVLVNYLRMGQALRAIPAIEKKRKDVATWTWPVHPLKEEWR